MANALTEHRKVALRAKIIDDNLNSWEDFAGVDINVEVAYRYAVGDGPDDTVVDHWSYRGQASVCQLANGNILRARIGDGVSDSDRKVYIQTITDPTNVSQWLSWSVLYSSDDHYSVSLVADDQAPGGYWIYTSKAGLPSVYDVTCTQSNVPYYVVKIKPVPFGNNTFLYVQAVVVDLDGNRTLDWFYCTDVTDSSKLWIRDSGNWRRYNYDMLCVASPDFPGSSAGTYYKFRSFAPEASARIKVASEILTVDTTIVDGTDDAEINTYENVRYIKGPSGQAGYKTTTNLYMTSFPSGEWSGAYFLFFNEQHKDQDDNVLSNLRMPLFWSRSVGFPYYLSEPQPVGFSVWGFAGAFLSGNYIYLCGNGRVLRRPFRSTEVEITNYVLSGSYEIPRGNEKAEGTITLANPGNVIGELLGITADNPAGVTDRRLWLEIGKQESTELVPTFKRDSEWWIEQIRKNKSNDKENLVLKFGNVWAKLDNPFRDVIFNPGHFDWFDWGEGGINQLYNYFNDSDEMFRYSPSVPDNQLWTIPRLRVIMGGDGPTIGGQAGSTISLLASWRGENAHVEAWLWSSNTGIVYRYADDQNFSYILVKTNVVEYHEVIKGTDSVDDQAVGSYSFPFFLVIDVIWARLRVYQWPTLLIDTFRENPPIRTGFVGFCARNDAGTMEVSDIRVYDYNYDITTRELIKTLLSYSDSHDVTIPVDTGTDRLVSLTWGPQSDLDTPSKALDQMLDSAKVQVKWLPDT